jgi:hypothetical protein
VDSCRPRTGGIPQPAFRGCLSLWLREPLFLRGHLGLRAGKASPFAGCGSLSVCVLQEPLCLRAAGDSPSAGCGSLSVCCLRESLCLLSAGVSSAGCRSPPARGPQGPPCPRGGGASLPAEREPFRPQTEGPLHPADRGTHAARRQRDSRRPQTGGLPQPAGRGTFAPRRQGKSRSPQTERLQQPADGGTRSPQAHRLLQPVGS